MILNDANIEFSTTWDIDQIVLQGSSPITSTGNFLLTALPTTPTNPAFAVQFKPAGSSVWYQTGNNSTDFGATIFFFWGYISNNGLYINVGTTGTARYYVWTDRVDN